MPDEFELYLSMIGGTTSLVVMRREERWLSANIERQRWVSEVLSGENMSKGQPGQRYGLVSAFRWGVLMGECYEVVVGRG